MLKQYIFFQVKQNKINNAHYIKNSIQQLTEGKKELNGRKCNYAVL